MSKEIIVVSAVWCPSCLILKKQIKKIREEYNVEFNYLDYDLDEDKVAEYNVGDTLPVMIVKGNDKEISRIVGEKSYEELIEFLKEAEVISKRR